MAQEASILMDLYTTCRGCGQIMTVTDEFAPAVHGLCVDRYHPTLLERIVDEFLAAMEAGRFAEADALEARANALADAQRTNPRLGEAALAYASWGWPVFPLRPGDKAPLTRHGFKDATTDPARIRRWWAETPAANIGLPTGVAFDVIDIDPPRGWSAWREMVDSGAVPAVHGLVCTARGGLHAYVAPSGGGNLAGIKPGVDYRGRGGYVVAPPSVRCGSGSSGSWSWRIKPSPAITSKPVAEAA